MIGLPPAGYPILFEEAQLSARPDPNDFKFSQGLLKVIATGAHTKEVERLRGVAYAVTTGHLLKPRIWDNGHGSALAVRRPRAEVDCVNGGSEHEHILK